MIDYEELAKRSLADPLGRLSDAQRKDFTDVLKRLVQRNYERNIKGILDYRVDYLGEDPESEGVLVHTRASSTTEQREEPISIDYRVTSPSRARSGWSTWSPKGRAWSATTRASFTASSKRTARSPRQADERQARQRPGGLSRV